MHEKVVSLSQFFSNQVISGEVANSFSHFHTLHHLFSFVTTPFLLFFSFSYRPHEPTDSHQVFSNTFRHFPLFLTDRSRRHMTTTWSFSHYVLMRRPLCVESHFTTLEQYSGSETRSGSSMFK